jgi:hypothetical protein
MSQIWVHHSLNSLEKGNQTMTTNRGNRQFVNSVIKEIIQPGMDRLMESRYFSDLRAEDAQSTAMEGIPQGNPDLGVAVPAHLHHRRLKPGASQGEIEAGLRGAGVKHEIRLLGRGFR